ncbi:hypothetical protein GIB67_003566 [Kingdonia uniflora]|uniref:CDT1 Geminin-binding domain-containing protein n=1 Tax=Kingdonia uniflora TaxID=39325 RepID=A0A7J7MEQ7_9MAGN|nr:hypothetical protein GIB67_003566 [Kingdonia uniflora]
MEEGKCDYSISSDINMKSSNPSPLPHVQNVKTELDSVNSFASPTPEKTTQPIRIKSTQAVKQLSTSFHKEDEFTGDEEVELPADIVVNEEVELPDKFSGLAEFFDRIDTSINVLRIRKKLPTFQKICFMVEALTNRKLTYNHLAQMKYLLPEAIQVEKILVQDEKTPCMMPDLKIIFLKGTSGFGPLRRVFRARLLEFFNNNPKGSDIPEAMLPFTQRDELVIRPSHDESPEISTTTPFEPEKLLLRAGSHLCEKTIGSFCKKKFTPVIEKTQLLSLPAPLLPGNSDSVLPASSLPKLPVQMLFTPKRSSDFKHLSASLDLVSPQLALQAPSQLTPPKRSIPMSDEKIDPGTERSISNSAAKRVLDFTLLEENESDDDLKHSMDIDLNSELAKSILLGDGFTTASSSVLAQMASWTESKPKLEKDPQGRASRPDLDQADWEKFFHEILNGRCSHEFQALLAEVITTETALQVTEDGKTAFNSWMTAKLLKPDSRYSKMPRRERESLWCRYVEEIQRKQKLTSDRKEDKLNTEATKGRSSLDSRRLPADSRRSYSRR